MPPQLRWMAESPASTWFQTAGAWPPLRPVLLSVPHAGRDYSAALIASARVPLAALRRLEDHRADSLVAGAVLAGFSAVIATAPRAEIDLNRAEWDCDPLALAETPAGLRPSQRARGGLGLIPTRLAGEGDLWRDPLTLSEFTRRVSEIHRPYHGAIGAALRTVHDYLGAATLLDIHSMPTPADPVDIVFGDRFGLTADARLVDALMATAEGHGFQAARNHPYAGAHSIERHARRSVGISAVQVEVARHCYLDADGRIDTAGQARCSVLVRALAECCADQIAISLPIAAE
jgi:N-formylglutamate amidohydrolase